MMEWKASSQRNPNARITGGIYLLYFLTAVLAQLLVGRRLVVPGNAANVIATALFSLQGCVVMTIDLFLPPLPIGPLLLFGLYCMLIGYLIFRSAFLPHVLGVLMALASLSWLVFLSHTLPHYLSLSIEGLGIVAEGSLMLWLLVMGVNDRRWKEQAAAA